MTLGGNDLLRVKADCKLPFILGPGCELARLPFREHTYGENLENIIRTIHRAGYRGKLVLVNTYAPDYSDAVANFALGRFNDEMRDSVSDVHDDVPGLDVRIADAFSAFKTRADAHGGKTCETGLLISNGDGTCDIHPTADGHAVLAQAILDAIR
jgi:lysophospholipase L1-like esterase